MKKPQSGQPACQLPPQRPDNEACSASAETQRTSAYEIVPQRGKARFKVRYREGSLNSDCKLCR